MWYYIVNQKVVGPVSLEEIINLINAGIIVKTTCLWQSGQVRQMAGQVPELVPFLQQEPLPRPEPTPRPVSKTASVPPKPDLRQVPRSQPVQTRQQPRTRTSTPKPTAQPVEETESTGSKVGLAFQIIGLVLIIFLSFGSFGATYSYKSSFRAIKEDFSRNGEYAQINMNAPDITGAIRCGIVFSVLAIIISIPVFIIGRFRKKQKISISCAAISLLFLCYAISTSVTENAEINNLQQHYYGKPYYIQVAKLHEFLNNRAILDIAENGVCEEHRYPRELQSLAQETISQYRELDQFNAQTMQMVIQQGNAREIENRCTFVNTTSKQLYQKFVDLYNRSKIDN